MMLVKCFLILGLFVSCLTKDLNAQQTMNTNQPLDRKHQSIITISAFTAKGDLTQLQNALSDGLDAGLTVNEIKEVLVHLYAYCGFPRSLQGINTFMAVLEARKTKGIIDRDGKQATPVKNSLSKYERGKNALETLTDQTEREPKTGYAAFSPVIDTFLKEHLFADIFGRDILSYSEREIATISALVSLGGVEPMMQGHMRIALNLGITESELQEMLSLIEAKVGKEEADAGRRVLSTVTNSKAGHNGTDSSSNIFTRGVRAPANHFTGIVWVNMVVQAQDQLDCLIGVVTFEPGARTNWHSHPGGQVLLVTKGKGYYQERGQPIKVIKKDDALKCPPGIEHWHGASPDMQLAHIAIATNAEKGNAVWLQRVTEEEYNSLK
ncbi:carboxymuconolactone decarboxylase family protein [Terrimonas pollutisoli]|uniref:carboxymuconolactone decarboxylase family protein n=1 Tax=Terrimonas pollutisoli TaxID=3034147 RepID=UPI0023EC9C52|nr:carboxymuconolactone decarboxylase family protein [Terrimonas sp. H1YJ31]